MQKYIILIKRKIIKKFELTLRLKMMKFLKKSIKNIFSLFNRHFIIFASIFLLYAFIGINFNLKIKLDDKFPTQRKLFSGFAKQKTEDICQKADKDLILSYESDSYFYIKENSSMKKSTSFLLNYVEDKEDSDLKSYIFSFYSQIILAALDILLIVIWILLCIFVSKDDYMDCLLKTRCVNKCLKNVFFIIAIAIYLVVVIMNIILLFNIHIFLQDINNSFCSFFKISYHTYNGEEYFYEIKPKWSGINQLKNLIQKTKDNLDKLTNQNKQINQKINEIKENKYFISDNNSFVEKYLNEFCDLNKYKVPNPNPLNDSEISEFLYCSDILYLAESEYNETFNNSISEINDIYSILISIDNNIDKIEFSLEYAKNKLDSFVKIIKDMELEYFDNLAYLFETVIRKYCIYCLCISFVVFVKPFLARADNDCSTISIFQILTAAVIAASITTILIVYGKTLEAEKGSLLALAAESCPRLIERGGGPVDLEIRELDETAAGPMLVLHLIMDVRDVMGANLIDTALEALAPQVEKISGGTVRLRILSNLADRRLARAFCSVPVPALAFKEYDGETVRDRMLEAAAFAEADPYRAVTHNKGIMNGIVAAALTFGQDIRAIEAAAYDYACLSGVHKPLAIWRYQQNQLTGTLELPITAGWMGGFRTNPAFDSALKFAQISSYDDLCGVLAAVGLAQNMAALWALSTEGIQAGHLKLHKRKLSYGQS